MINIINFFVLIVMINSSLITNLDGEIDIKATDYTNSISYNDIPEGQPMEVTQMEVNLYKNIILLFIIIRKN